MAFGGAGPSVWATEDARACMFQKNLQYLGGIAWRGIEAPGYVLRAWKGSVRGGVIVDVMGWDCEV